MRETSLITSAELCVLKHFTHLRLRSALSPVFMINFTGFILSRTSSLRTEALHCSRSTASRYKRNLSTAINNYFQDRSIR